MKKNITRILILLSTFVSTGVANGQEGLIDLYIQPDIQSRNVDSIMLDDPRLGQPAPVMDDAMAALGWHYAEFEDIVHGYTPDGKIGKDLLPVNGTIIYAGPSTDSPVLGTYKDGSSIEIMDTGAWWKFQTTMRFPVYFVLDTIPTPPPLPRMVAEPEQPPVVTEPVPPVASAPVITETPVVDMEPQAQSTQRPEGMLQREKQVSSTPVPGIIGQRYQGTFKHSRKIFGLFKPKAPFYLESEEGNRVAWVDTSNIVIPGSLKTYLDKVVIIHGERDFLTSSRDWIIRARNMRLK